MFRFLAHPRLEAERLTARADRRSTRAGLGRAAIAGLVLGLPLFLTVSAVASGPALAGGPTVLGEGSSYAAVALDQWTAQMASFYGDNINYQTSSSVIGLNDYAQGQLNFAASEIGYSTGQSAYTPSGAYAHYQYMPDVAGAICLMYNLQTTTGAQITNLQLDMTTLLKIFSGQITTWSDPAILALNPEYGTTPSTTAMSHEPVIKAYRSDASGDNYIFTDYLSTLDPNDWNAFTAAMGQPAGAQAIFPTPSDGAGGVHGAYDITGFEGQNGSDVASEYVNDNPNSLTYVETAYALRLHRPCAAVENAAGDFVTPSEVGDAVALTKDELEPDLEQILTGVFENTNPQAYPISAYSYLITQQSTPGSPEPSADAGAVLGQFIQFIACRGQQAAGTLGYSPLPPNLVEDDFEAVNRLNGAAQLPTPTAQNCPNPYLTGQLQLPGEPIQLTTIAGVPAGSAAPAGSAGAAGHSSGTGASNPAPVAPTSASNPDQVAATEAAAVARLKAESGAPQIPGVALAAAVVRLLGLSGPTARIVSWTLLLLVIFAGVPGAIAAAGRRRRRRRSAEVARLEDEMIGAAS
ncbi:MAG: substrate-binding domain-containing protein [Acidimicrobiales bacterium]